MFLMSVDECVENAEKEVAKALQFKSVETIKEWGKEIIIADGPSYCGKLLIVNPGCSSSVHKHNSIDETLYVLTGAIVVDVFPQGYNNGASKRERHNLKEGESLRIPPGVLHQFYSSYNGSVEQSMVVETSTRLVEGDVHRLKPQDSDRTSQP